MSSTRTVAEWYDSDDPHDRRRYLALTEGGHLLTAERAEPSDLWPPVRTVGDATSPEQAAAYAAEHGYTCPVGADGRPAPEPVKHEGSRYWYAASSEQEARTFAARHGRVVRSRWAGPGHYRSDVYILDVEPFEPEAVEPERQPLTAVTWASLPGRVLNRDTAPRSWEAQADLAHEAAATNPTLTLRQYRLIVEAACSGLPLVLTYRHRGADPTITRRTVVVEQVTSLRPNVTDNIRVRLWGFAYGLSFHDLIEVEAPAAPIWSEHDPYRGARRDQGAHPCLSESWLLDNLPEGWSYDCVASGPLQGFTITAGDGRTLFVPLDLLATNRPTPNPEEER